MTASFYDGLAPFYHLLFEDWEGSVARQGSALAQLLDSLGVHRGDEVLDAACGIGTQTLGLVENGYRVTASDLSAGAIERIRSELARRSRHATTQVDDIRLLNHVKPASMAAVIACDNSIPHLLSDAEIVQAFRSCIRCIRPGGAAVFSVRDYATVERRSPDVRPYGLRIDREGNRFLAVQVWEWDAEHYDLRMYLTTESPSHVCDTRVLLARYYAIAVERLVELMEESGFVDVRRHDAVLYQPVLTGKRAA